MNRANFVLITSLSLWAISEIYGFVTMNYNLVYFASVVVMPFLGYSFGSLLHSTQKLTKHQKALANIKDLEEELGFSSYDDSLLEQQLSQKKGY